jgi:hypothetical protein
MGSKPHPTSIRVCDEVPIQQGTDGRGEGLVDDPIRKGCSGDDPALAIVDGDQRVGG